MSAPIVASYCTTFLKPEMLHIYRQVTGLRRFRTFVVTKERVHPDKFPFDDIELVPRKPRKNFIRRFYLKHVRKLPAIYYRGELQGLMKIFRRREADLMHVYFGHTGVHLLPFIQGWDKPCLVSFHGADVMLRPEHPEYEQQLRELLRTIPLALARSQSLAERLVELGCDEGRIRLNRTGIPLYEFPALARTAPADGAWRLVQACRLIPKKGLPTTLAAFAKLHAHFPAGRLAIAGDGPLRAKLQQQISALQLDEAVTLTGFLNQPELAKLYAEAHIFVHPSVRTEDQNQEGVPNSMLEAMASGLPVLATWHGGIPEAVTHEENGFLVPENDAEALAEAMRRMTETPGRANEMGAHAARAVRENFEHSAQVAKLESFYDELLAARGAHGQ